MLTNITTKCQNFILTEVFQLVKVTQTDAIETLSVSIESAIEVARMERVLNMRFYDSC